MNVRCGYRLCDNEPTNDVTVKDSRLGGIFQRRRAKEPKRYCSATTATPGTSPVALAGCPASSQSGSAFSALPCPMTRMRGRRELCVLASPLAWGTDNPFG